MAPPPVDKPSPPAGAGRRPNAKGSPRKLADKAAKKRPVKKAVPGKDEMDSSPLPPAKPSFSSPPPAKDSSALAAAAAASAKSKRFLQIVANGGVFPRGASEEEEEEEDEEGLPLPPAPTITMANPHHQPDTVTNQSMAQPYPDVVLPHSGGSSALPFNTTGSLLASLPAYAAGVGIGGGGGISGISGRRGGGAKSKVNSVAQAAAAAKAFGGGSDFKKG